MKRDRLVLLLCILLLAAGAVFFHGTLTSTSAARIAAMRTVEPYALAVHEQLVYNFGTSGRWVQTIHAGYTDAWTWSGHHALTLIVVAWLYALSPSALWLTELQILATALGVVPAALIGRSVLRSPWGLLLGGGVYLLHPAVIATALQDYQDLSLAVPALTFTLWTLRTERWAWVPLGVLVGLAPREECIPLVVACALVTLPPGGRRRWLLNLAVAAVLAGAYAAVTTTFFPAITGMAGPGQDSRLVGALRELAHGPTALAGWPHLHDFYALLWAPVGLAALLSPLTLLPGLGLVALHMAIPDGHGIDRWWFGHAHHLAPVLPFVIVATIEGLGRVLRPLAAWRPAAAPPAGPALSALAGAALLTWSAWWVSAWGTGFHLAWSWTPQDPPYRHPAWVLAERLPPDAVPVVSVRHSIAVSNRPVSYTWEESLHDKARGKGLGAATHLVAPAHLAEITAWALAMEGAAVVDEHDGYVTIAWKAGATDGAGKRREDRWPDVPDWTPEGFGTHSLPGVPPRPR